MGVVQLPDALQHVIEREVAAGRADSAAAFLEEAVLRLVDATAAEDAEIAAIVEAGTADIDAGRYTTIVTREDEESLRGRLMSRLRARLDAGE